LDFRAKRVFLVLGSRDRVRKLRVFLDGRAYRTLTIRDQQLYTLVDQKTPGRHTLELRPEAGIKGYAFTFG
jgi:hypothetical protein